MIIGNFVYDNYPINQKKKAIKQGPPVTVTPCSNSIISNRKEEEKKKKQRHRMILICHEIPPPKATPQ